MIISISTCGNFTLNVTPSDKTCSGLLFTRKEGDVIVHEAGTQSIATYDAKGLGIIFDTETIVNVDTFEVFKNGELIAFAND